MSSGCHREGLGVNKTKLIPSPKAPPVGGDSAAGDRAPALELVNITKSFGHSRVLDRVTLSVLPGELTALLGENGAGKSTLAKIIAGSVRPDSGSIAVCGKWMHMSSPRESMTHGIAFVPQELSYLADLTVAENVLLGRVPTRFGVTSRKAIIRQAEAEAEAVGFDLPLGQRMGDIPMMQQQMVELLKAFASNPRIIILDEPTAALEAEDSTRLLTLTEAVAKQGVALIYISHRLDEVFEYCHTLHVLHEGSMVLAGSTSKVTRSQAIRAMLDRSLDDVRVAKQVRASDKAVLAATDLNKSSHPVLKDVSFTIHEGEIVGLYGLRGAGAATTAEAVVGLHADCVGQLTLDEVSLQMRGPHHAADRRVGHIPADRKSQGLVLEHPIMHALSLPALSEVTRAGVIVGRTERARSQSLAQRTRLKAQGLQQPLSNLSGGNQQKVLLASRLTKDLRLLVLQEPTRGVDVGARTEIHRLLRKLVDEGCAQLLVSSDIEEAVLLCDRLLIMRGGRIVHEIQQPTLASQVEALEHAGGLVE